MNFDFYGMAQEFLGVLPASSNYLYDFLTIIFAFITLMMICIPIIYMLKFAVMGVGDR
jgi:hypothetical protein